MKRAFTRSQIEAYFEERWGKTYREGGDEVKINDVKLLKGLGQPIWVLDFTVISEGYLEAHRYHSHLIFIQEKAPSGEWRLGFPGEVKLPQGCPSVAEEDKAIQAEAEEAERVAERRTRIETHMAADYGGDY